MGDAVDQGFVASLARPGGNITGLSWFAPELSAKSLEVLKDALPAMSHVAILREAAGGAASATAAGTAARRLGVKANSVIAVLLDTNSIWADGPKLLDGDFARLAVGRG